MQIALHTIQKEMIWYTPGWIALKFINCWNCILCSSLSSNILAEKLVSESWCEVLHEEKCGAGNVCLMTLNDALQSNYPLCLRLSSGCIPKSFIPLSSHTKTSKKTASCWCQHGSVHKALNSISRCCSSTYILSHFLGRKFFLYQSCIDSMFFCMSYFKKLLSFTFENPTFTHWNICDCTCTSNDPNAQAELLSVQGS